MGEEESDMIEPGVALLGFGAAAALTAGLVWPRHGLVPRVRGLVRATERVRTEDALKHLHGCEYAGRAASVESVAGALELKGAAAARLLSRMAERGLIEVGAEGVGLTAEGRAYGAQVIRSHRLWERYLADRTGVHASEWHVQAEEREHTMSAAEADALAARLGHPLYDPHGDPIPSADGALPPAEGVSLAGLAPGEVATVVHLEDEPAEVFRVLLREGLAPGERLEVLSSGAAGIRYRAGGRTHALERMLAASVTVRREAAASVAEDASERLAELRAGESARVVRLAAACQGAQRRRLLDLGVVPGTRITSRLESAGRDPVAYDIRGALIALRREQAEWIHVRREPAGGKPT